MSGAIRRFGGRLKGWLLPRPEQAAWRHACRLAGRTPRYAAGTIELMGYRLRYVDLTTLCPQWDEIFVREVYKCALREPAPRILDCGANVGLASLYFKRSHPRARVTAFEADPLIHAALRENLDANGAADVESVHAAVWVENGVIEFRCEGADSGALSSLGGAQGTPRTVPALRLKDALAAGPVDLLKLDVEGAESAILADCAPALGNVRALIVEVHELDASRRRAPALLEGLSAAGFVYAVDTLEPLPWRDPPRPDSPFPERALSWVSLVHAWRA